MKTPIDATNTVIIYSGAGSIYVTTPEPLSITLENISFPHNFYTVKLPESILKDKLPDDLIEKSNNVVELSQSDKLFGIES